MYFWFISIDISIYLYVYTHVFFHAIHCAGCWHSASQFQASPGTHPRAHSLLSPGAGALPTFPWGSRQAAKRCRGGLGCSSNPFSSPRPSPPSQPVSRTLPTLSPSIPTALRSRLCCPGEVWQSASIIREVATLRVLLGGVEVGATACTPSSGGDGAAGCSSPSQDHPSPSLWGYCTPPYPTKPTPRNPWEPQRGNGTFPPLSHY